MRLLSSMITISALSVCIASSLLPVWGLEGQFTEDLSQALRETENPNKTPNNPNTIYKGYVGNTSMSRPDLQAQDAQFQAKLASQRDASDRTAFADFIRQGAFFGNPILIRLDPPNESDAMHEVYASEKRLEATMKQFEKCESQLCGFYSAIDKTLTPEKQPADETATKHVPKPSGKSVDKKKPKAASNDAEAKTSDTDQHPDKDGDSDKDTKPPTHLAEILGCEANTAETGKADALKARLAKTQKVRDYDESVYLRNRNPNRETADRARTERSNEIALNVKGELEQELASHGFDYNTQNAATAWRNLSAKMTAFNTAKNVTNALALDEAAEHWRKITLTRQITAGGADVLDTVPRQFDVWAEGVNQSLARLVEAGTQLREANTDFLSDSISNQSRLATYLLVANYNIPGLKPRMLPYAYRYANLRLQPMLRPPLNGDRQEAIKLAAQPDATSASLCRKLGYKSVRLISEYPTNLFLNASLDNTNAWTFQANPQYSGFSAGSITYNTSTELKYKVQFPEVVGMGNQDALMQFTYYPAKAQKIAYGSKTVYAVIALPMQDTEDVLQLNASLEYQLKFLKLFPNIPQRAYVTSFIATNQALRTRKQIDLFRRTYLRMLQPDDQRQLERILDRKDPVSVFAQASADSDNTDSDSDDDDSTTAKSTDKKQVASGGASAKTK